MIKIGILGDIGSGKSYVAKGFGYPVFNADNEVAKLYKKNKKIFVKLKKILPKNIKSFPIEKKEITEAILQKKGNLKKIIKIVHAEVRKKMNLFFKKNKSKKFVVLDVPLLLENKLNKKGDILIFVDSKNSTPYIKIIKCFIRTKNIIPEKKIKIEIILNDFIVKSLADSKFDLLILEKRIEFKASFILFSNFDKFWPSARNPICTGETKTKAKVLTPTSLKWVKIPEI